MEKADQVAMKACMLQSTAWTSSCGPGGNFVGADSFLQPPFITRPSFLSCGQKQKAVSADSWIHHMWKRGRSRAVPTRSLHSPHAVGHKAWPLTQTAVVTMQANNKSPHLAHQTAGRQFHKNRKMSSKMSSPRWRLGCAVGCESEPCSSFGLPLLCLRWTTTETDFRGLFLPSCLFWTSRFVHELVPTQTRGARCWGQSKLLQCREKGYSC